MRLKELLFESKEDARKLNRLLETKFRNDLVKLFRATDRKIEGNYALRKIQKDRKPIGGTMGAQVFLDVLAEIEYQNVPKRSESKFARTLYADSKGLPLDMFGEYKYLVFPEKDANIVSFDEDSKKWRSNLDNSLRTFKRAFQKDFSEEERKDLYPNTHKFLTLLFQGSSTDPYVDFLKNNWRSLKEELKQLKKDLAHVAGEIDKILNPLYFRKMEFGVEHGKSEVIFDGESYLYVKEDFFDEHFTYNGNKWILENET